MESKFEGKGPFLKEILGKLGISIESITIDLRVRWVTDQQGGREVTTLTDQAKRL